MIDLEKLTAIAEGLGIAGAETPGAYKSAAPPYRGFVPPPIPPRDDRDLIAAALAGGMIAAGGKAVTAEEAVQLFTGVKEAMAARL